MEFFRRKKDKKAAVQTVSTGLNVSHPFSVIENYSPRADFEMKLYSTLKEAVPIIDAAISKIVRLVGDFKISCEDKDIEYEINKFMSNIQVNAWSEQFYSNAFKSAFNLWYSCGRNSCKWRWK